MIFDRGNKKWTSIFLPEHREMLDLWRREKEYQPPELDEQALEEIQRILLQAWHHHACVGIRYWNEQGEQSVIGKIIQIDSKKVRIVNDGGEVDIPTQQIIAVIE